MNDKLVIGAFFFISACGGGGSVAPTTDPPLPSELGKISYGGLNYSPLNGGVFDGMPVTDIAQMPTSGASAVFEGVTRGRIDEYYETGTAKLVANFDAGTLLAEGSVNFAGAGGHGVIDYSQEANIMGNSFYGISETDPNKNPNLTPVTVTGKFYADNADMAAGTITSPAPGGSEFTGVFITKRP